MNKKVAIIGNGWVGKAMQELFPNAVTYVRDYQKALQRSELLEDFTYTDDKKIINQADIAFICVPTPSMPEGYNTNGAIDDSDEGYPLHEGKLDTSIVEEIISWCKCPIIVIRSTVNPGDCDRWSMKYNKQICHQPEYLGETPNHPLLDTQNTPFLIIGGLPQNTRKVIELYQTVYNANISIRQVSNKMSEIIKLSENRAIAFKVAECQELYDVCQKAGILIDYYEIRDAVYGDDPRFNLWWTFVYPNKRGFNSKCIPKDIYAWCAWAESLGYEPKITRGILEKNKEWIGGV